VIRARCHERRALAPPLAVVPFRLRGGWLMPEHDRTEALLARLSERAAALGLASLPAHEQAALIAFTAHGAISRGGFRSFFEGPLPLADLVAALRTLKLNALANTASSTAALFPDPALAEDPAARRAHLDGLASDRQDYAFFRLSAEEMVSAIAAYWKRVGLPPSV
jgi:hypothetical protein